MTLPNPPNQPSLAFRIGTYETFLDAMLARLADQGVPDGSDGALAYPLARLTTRDRSDLSIALLDAWAVAGDVASFYQERIANEAFLGTAQQTGSVALAVADIGYEFQPAVAASASLAFTINPLATRGPVMIPSGTQVLSAPATGQPSNVFETWAALEARADWNALRPVQTIAQVLDATTTSVDVLGTVGEFSAGQPLAFYDGRNLHDFRLVQAISAGAAPGSVRLTWARSLTGTYAQPSVVTFQQQANVFGFNAPVWQDLPAGVRAQYGDNLPGPIACMALAPDGQHFVTGQTDGTLVVWTLDQSAGTTPAITAGQAVPAHPSVNSVAYSPDGTRIASAGSDGLIRIWDTQLTAHAGLTGHAGSVNSIAFSPNFATDSHLVSGGADGDVRLWAVVDGTVQTFSGHTSSVMSVAYSPDGQHLLSGSQDRTVRLWPVGGEQVHVCVGHGAAVTCVSFSPEFHADATFVSGGADNAICWWTSSDTSPTRTATRHTATVTSVAFSPAYGSDERLLSTSLDQTAIVWTSTTSTPLRQHFLAVNQGAFLQPSGAAMVNWAITVSADTTAILWNLASAQPTLIASQQRLAQDWPHFALAPDSVDLASVNPSVAVGGGVALWTGDGTNFAISDIDSATTRSASAYMLSARVTSIGLASTIDPSQFPRRDTLVGVQNQPLTLATLPFTDPVQGTSITLDQPVVGLRPGHTLALAGIASGSHAAEVLAVESVDVDALGQPTLLRLQQPLARHYVRSSVTLNANVVLATHGETVASEVLGSGDGRRSHQQFTLRRAPLTYVPDASASGVRDSLRVFVNGVQWQEVPSFYGATGHAQVYTVRTNPTGAATVEFGDGVQGARLPTGTENVTATYRVGAGLLGEVGAGTLTQLKSSNPSISAVTNLLAASGASNADTALTARRRAPRTATTLSRIVSLTDYDDFVQSFAGVGRARTSLLWNGATQVVHITFLGADQQEIPADSLLYRSLSQAIDAVRELSRKVVLQSGSNLIRSFDVEASLVLAPGRRAEQVLPVARTGLVRAFAFDRRAFGAGVALSEVIGVLQNVAGVLAVDMHALNVEGTTRALHTYLSVDRAHWGAAGAFVPDQLLVINANDGIHLDVQPGA